MKLVTFQEPIFKTIQGEGSLSGTPSTFVRLYGCNFGCSWCDSKGSWKEGSTFEEVDVFEVLSKVRKMDLRHVVITGGDPLIQSRGLCQVVAHLKATHHITIETQGSEFSPCVADIGLLSLSPKLHDWRPHPLKKLISVAYAGRSDIQVKVVVCSKEDTINAINLLTHLTAWCKAKFGKAPIMYLQPEYSGGRKLVKEVIDYTLSRPNINRVMDLRVLPQLHKTSLYVV